MDWKQGLNKGIIAGVIWGWIALGLSLTIGALEFESGLWHNLVTFSVGGALFGMILGAFMVLLEQRLPFKKCYVKTLFLSISLWLILRFGGVLLSSVDLVRYQAHMSQSVYGFLMTLVLGSILGVVWTLHHKENY